MQLIGAMLLGTVVGWLLTLLVPSPAPRGWRVAKHGLAVVCATFSVATVAWVFLARQGAFASLSGVLLGALGGTAVKWGMALMVST